MAEGVCADVRVLPHVSDDQVGRRNEEVLDPLKSRVDGVMHFSHAGLWNYLCTTIQNKFNMSVCTV